MDTNVLIGGVCAIAGVVLSYLAFAREQSNDDKKDGVQDGTILTELGYIKSNTDEIKSEQKEQRRINVELYTRISSVEASAKQAHKRLDNIEIRSDHE